MQHLKILILGFWLTSGLGAVAQGSGVVVELYTSQGCNSCPPADAFFGELAKREGVIALSLHVDYWDYIGWKDRFAQKTFTKRQKAYARAGGRRMVYTPQIIVGGMEHVVGSDKTAINQLIKAHLAGPILISISQHRMGNKVVVDMNNISASSNAMAVQLVRYHRGQTIDIKRGENAGKSISYYNIVTDWELVQGWDGQSPLKIAVDLEQGENAVILVQDAPNGAILAASRLN